MIFKTNVYVLHIKMKQRKDCTRMDIFEHFLSLVDVNVLQYSLNILDDYMHLS